MRFKFREHPGRRPEAGREVTEAEFAHVPRVDELLEVDRDGKTEERFAEVEGLTDQIMAGVGDGVGAAGEVFEDGARIERLERQIALDRLLVAITIDDGGSFELARDINESAEGRRRLVDENVI